MMYSSYDAFKASICFGFRFGGFGFPHSTHFFFRARFNVLHATLCETRRQRQ
jgi:hypothetical protein